MSQGIIHNFVWLRVIGDTIFAIGVLVLGWFILGLKTGWSLTGEQLSYDKEGGVQ
jgi:nitric oxide reductase subunit B